MSPPAWSAAAETAAVSRTGSWICAPPFRHCQRLAVAVRPLACRSWVKIGQVRTLSVERLSGRLGRIAPEELDRIVEGLNEIVG